MNLKGGVETDQMIYNKTCKDELMKLRTSRLFRILYPLNENQSQTIVHKCS